MFDTETCCESVFADTDTLHITLSCMVYTFDAVDVVMEFTFDNRFKIRLHVLSCNFYNVSDAVLAAHFHFVCFRTNHCDLMIFDFRSFYCMYKFCTVYTGTVEFYLHITTTDDFTFECRCESNRNINVCDFDLNITSFQGCCIEFINNRLTD